ncbi:MAG: ABC transporter ATP-binding protein [Chloroflexi bacterium]|nr:MAG: ABC transporter ATP-binding protein [Chloroflexota bacterium]
MNLVTIENLSFHYGERPLLENANLLINDGDRIGLIGRNGSGKTTLLRLIAGEETAVSGQITIHGHVHIQYLPQQPRLNPNLTVLQTVLQSDAPHFQLLQQYEQTSRQLQTNPTDHQLQAKLAELTNQLDHTGAWAAEAEAKAILTRLGITNFSAPIHTLSGGQQKRVALAQALIAPANLLILDEPTNHIDADAIAWLEEYLRQRPGALLMVTHDRYFLDRVVNRIIELDRRQLVNYPGNYEKYLELSAKRHTQLAAAEAKRQAILRRELEWLRRGAKARTTKQKARKQRITELQQIQYDRGGQQVAMALASRRLGKQVLEAQNLSKRYGDSTLFANLDFTLNPGDRIGIIGPNGSGKTTFLDILAGKIQPDTGTVRWGETVHLGYYDQHSADLREDMRVIDYIQAEAPLIYTNDGRRVEAAQMLEWFLFTRPEQQTYIGSLSGGERRRLYMLRTLIHQPNVLFLDEPTNDLDIQTLAVLEEFLDQFQGCLVVVSHDRYFLDRNVDFLMSFEEGIIGTRFPTPYETYRQIREQMSKSTLPKTAESPAPTRSPKQPSPTSPRKLTWREQQEMTRLEAEIETLTAQISQLEAEINTCGDDYRRLQTLSDELAKHRTALETAEMRWLELAERTS